MDLRHLYTFRAIAEEGSFVQAALRLQYAQSTITLQIQQLEEELGVELFDRQRRKIQLTEAGQTLLTHTRHVLGQIELMQQELAELADGVRGHLRVGIIEPMARLYLTDVVRAFHARFPRMHLTLDILSTLRIHEYLATNKIDLGISTPPAFSENLSFEPLLTESMALLLPEDHPLQEHAGIQLSDLRNEYLLLTHPPCAYRRMIEQAFLEHGLPLAVSIEVGSLEIIKQMVQQGVGVAILPSLALRPTPRHTVVRTIDDWYPSLTIGLISREIPPPYARAAQAFGIFLKEALPGKARHESYEQSKKPEPPLAG